MADEKKLTKEEIKNEELTDEQVNEAVGGVGYASSFRCQGGCGRTYSGTPAGHVNGKKYCVNCFAKYQKQGSAGRSGII